MEKIANLPSISATLMPIVQKDGADAAIAKYRDLKAHMAGAYDFSESELNGLGYALLRMKNVDEAVKMFELNVEMYPASANTTVSERRSSHRAIARKRSRTTESPWSSIRTTSMPSSS